MRIVYVSPLKALSYDIERNLRAPLRGIGADISVGLRTGDTRQTERRAMRKTPPDILITTPESLYLMLSSGVREILATTEAVIVDEIHAVAQSKRGSHLALTLERLERSVASRGRTRPSNAGRLASPPATGIQRIGLSATQRPLERIAQFLVGPEARVQDRRCRAARRSSTWRSSCRSRTWPNPGAPDFPNADGRPAPRASRNAHVRSIWPAIYPELLSWSSEHNSTIIFVNTRRAAERLAKRLNELANGEAEQRASSDGARGTPGQGSAEDSGEAGEPASDRRRPSRSPAPTTAPSPTRSGPWSRRCSSRGSCPASSRRRRWSWGSTWARSTW